MIQNYINYIDNKQKKFCLNVEGSLISAQALRALGPSLVQHGFTLIQGWPL